MAVEKICGRKVLEAPGSFGSVTAALSAVVHNYPATAVDQILVGDAEKLGLHQNAPVLLGQLASVVSKAGGFSTALQCKECNFHCDGFNHDFKEKLRQDVFAAYFSLLEESHTRLNHPRCSKEWAKQLGKVKREFDSCELIRMAKRSGVDGALNYLDKFTKPAFLYSFVDLAVPKGAKLVESYSLSSSGAVEVYSVPGVAEKYYLLKPLETSLSLEEAKLLDNVLDSITRHEATVVDPLTARHHFRQMALKLLHDKGNKEEFADVIVRHSAGYGLLELLLSDPEVQDVYIDSPGDSPVYIYHGKFEECISNIGFTSVDLEKLGSRLRAVSARPFDESSPVINTELADLAVRVCGLCPPATFAGYGFAFRKHRPSPWTLAQFVAAKMIDSRTAGLLSFLVDGQRSLLVTGSRGSGKSSLLSALLAEVSPVYRMVVIEDTPELPIDDLRSYGHKVQHMRIKASIGEETGGLELSAQEALRTALRLGESVLVLGEVRGLEAKSLFEAMRVGAAGNVVMGTIHGSSAYDTWDRIVNDLGVPTTSFKATDAVISLASVRAGDETKRLRRLVSVTEVKKHWRQDPFHENGFNDLVSYSPFNDSWKHNLLKSDVIRDIGRLKKFSDREVEKNIECRANVKALLVKSATSLRLPALLELKATVDSNRQYSSIVSEQISEHGKVNYGELLQSYSKWLGGYCKELARQ